MPAWVEYWKHIKRANCTMLVCTMFAALAGAEFSPCQKAANTGAKSEAQSPAQQKARPLTVDEQSCKNFVQRFYDWYWNRFADPGKDFDKMPGVGEVEKRKPPVLSQKLIKLIDEDQKQAAAEDAAPNMDFDPFIGGNGGAAGKYNVVTVVVTQGTCRATLTGSETVEPELKKTASSWIFVDFHYGSFYEGGKQEDSHLLRVLSH